MHPETLYGDDVARSTLAAWKRDAVRSARRHKMQRRARTRRALATLAQLALVAAPIAGVTWAALTLASGS